MAEHPNATLLREGFEMFNRADIDGLTGLIAADAVQRMPGNGPISGEHKGRDNILQLYGRIGEMTAGTFRANLEELYANDDRVIAVYRGTAEREGRRYDRLHGMVFQLVGGQIVAVDDLASDIEAFDSFFA